MKSNSSFNSKNNKGRTRKSSESSRKNYNASDNRNTNRFLDKKDNTESKPYYKDRSESSTTKKTYEKKPYDSSEKRGTNRFFDKKDSRESKPYERKPYNKEDAEKSEYKKPYERKSSDSSERKTTNRFSDKKEDGEKKPYQRKVYNKDERENLPYKRKYEKKEYFTGDRKKSIKPKNVREDDGLIRLNKFIANAGICSRREADDLIKAGAVTVNGKIITEMGHRINPTDLVNYGGQGLKSEKMVYILINKPKDFITTSDDPFERKTVMSLIKDACKERVYPVGRLDRNTTGLLLFTNDGALTEKLTHPSTRQKKIYHVELDKPLSMSHYNQIQEGIELEDGFIKVDEINYVTGAPTKKEVGVELHSGRNRIVRRIFEHFEYTVVKLDRVYMAGLTKKDLPRGRWRFLTNTEVNLLKQQV